jgi:hypothetical protein
MPRKLSYDSECELLARHFLADETDVPEAAFAELAEQIQQTVEDFMNFDLPTLKLRENKP